MAFNGWTAILIIIIFSSCLILKSKAALVHKKTLVIVHTWVCLNLIRKYCRVRRFEMILLTLTKKINMIEKEKCLLLLTLPDLLGEIGSLIGGTAVLWIDGGIYLNLNVGSRQQLFVPVEIYGLTHVLSAGIVIECSKTGH